VRGDFLKPLCIPRVSPGLECLEVFPLSVLVKDDYIHYHNIHGNDSVLQPIHRPTLPIHAIGAVRAGKINSAVGIILVVGLAT